MSEQVRFKIEGCKVNPDLASICITFVKDKNGEYVRYEDYARLQAEVERLEESRNYFIHKMMLNMKQVDALTSAGDSLQDAFLKLTSNTPNWDGKVYWNWNAAKEGKPQS